MFCIAFFYLDFQIFSSLTIFFSVFSPGISRTWWFELCIPGFYSGKRLRTVWTAKTGYFSLSLEQHLIDFLYSKGCWLLKNNKNHKIIACINYLKRDEDSSSNFNKKNSFKIKKFFFVFFLNPLDKFLW